MKRKPFNWPLFVDCGAPSLYNKMSRKVKNKYNMGSSFSNRKFDDFSYTDTPEYKEYFQSYIDFLLENKDKVDTYSNLDVINNPVLTYKNQITMEKAGLSPIPVFHLGSDEKWLKRYLKKHDYIALGGLVPNPTKVLIPMLDKLFKEYLLDEDGFPTHKVHGFACTSMILMERYPWYSVDSTKCRKEAIYGKIALPAFSSKKINFLPISARDVPLKYKTTAGIIKAVQERAEEYNTSIEILSTNDTQRAVWNYLVFAEKLLEVLPKWPWNFYTKKAKKGAKDFMIFYFAGVLSEKEEIVFWNKVIEKDVEATKGRLQSFFYKPQLKQVINLKAKENEGR